MSSKYNIGDYIEVLARRSRGKESLPTISRATMIPSTTVYDWIRGNSAPREASHLKSTVKRWGPEAGVKRYEEDTGTKVEIGEEPELRQGQIIHIKFDPELMELFKQLVQTLRR